MLTTANIIEDREIKACIVIVLVILGYLLSYLFLFYFPFKLNLFFIYLFTIDCLL